ncbi:MAG: hypothetical protein K2P93_09130 [Alphaproteobacteria bacterium]|nr:hypothetical protein [Alphaproteobacteria bacterium]
MNSRTLTSTLALTLLMNAPAFSMQEEDRASNIVQPKPSPKSTGRSRANPLYWILGSGVSEELNAAATDTNSLPPSTSSDMGALSGEESAVTTTLRPVLLKLNTDFNFLPSHPLPQGFKLFSDPDQTRGTTLPLSVISKGIGHIAVTGDGFVSYFEIPKGTMLELSDRPLRFEAMLRSKTPGATIGYREWPFNEPKINSTPHSGSGEWEKLSIDFIPNGTKQKFFLFPVNMPGVEEGSEAPEVEIKGISIKEIMTSGFQPEALNFSLETDPSTSNPRGYKLEVDPALQRGTAIPLSVAPRGEGHVALTGDGYVFYTHAPMKALTSLTSIPQKLTYQVDVKSNTPGVHTQVWQWPSKAEEKIKSDLYLGNGDWQTLSITFTPDANKKRIYMYPAVVGAVSEGAPVPEVEVRNLRLALQSTIEMPELSPIPAIDSGSVVSNGDSQPLPSSSSPSEAKDERIGLSPPAQPAAKSILPNWLSWLFGLSSKSTTPQPTLTNADLKEVPSESAFTRALIHLKETDSNAFQTLVARSSDTTFEGLSPILNGLLQNSIQYNGVKDTEFSIDSLKGHQEALDYVLMIRKRIIERLRVGVIESFPGFNVTQSLIMYSPDDGK